MGAGRSQGWGLGGLGGKSRAGQDGQVRGPGSPGRESGTSGWGRQYHPSWPQSPQSPLGSRPQRSEPSRTLPSHRPHGFLSQPPAPLTPRNLVNPSGAPPPGPPWHGGVGVGRCEWGLLGEASPQPYTHLFVLLHAFICQERPRGLWSAPQAAATFPTWAACPSLQPWRAGLVEPPKTAKSITLCHSLPSSKQRRFCPHLGPEQTACLREAPGPEPLGAPVAPHPAGSVPACPPPRLGWGPCARGLIRGLEHRHLVKLGRWEGVFLETEYLPVPRPGAAGQGLGVRTDCPHSGGHSVPVSGQWAVWPDAPHPSASPESGHCLPHI